MVVKMADQGNFWFKQGAGKYPRGDPNPNKASHPLVIRVNSVHFAVMFLSDIFPPTNTLFHALTHQTTEGNYNLKAISWDL